MAIYGRFGDVVTIVRVGTLEDVKNLDGARGGKPRKIDAADRLAVENGSYVVVRQDDGKERLYHQAYLRADEGAREVGRTIEALGEKTP